MAAQGDGWLHEELKRLVNRVCQLETERADLESRLYMVSDENERLRAELKTVRVERAAEVAALQARTQTLTVTIQELTGQQQLQWQPQRSLLSSKAMSDGQRRQLALEGGLNPSAQAEMARTVEALARRRDELKAKLQQVREFSTPARVLSPRTLSPRAPSPRAPSPRDNISWEYQWPKATPERKARRTPSPPRERNRSNSYFQAVGIPRKHIEDAARRGRW